MVTSNKPKPPSSKAPAPKKAAAKPAPAKRLVIKAGDTPAKKPDAKASKPPKAKTAPKAAITPQKTAEKRPPGRPTTFTQEVADEICTRIANGEPLRQICRDDKMPSWRTVYGWKESNEAFSARFARERVIGEDAIAHQCLEIADEPAQRTAFGGVDGGDIQHKKLRIETRLKLLAKWNPTKYGDKVDVNHGVQPENPLMALLSQVSGSALPVRKDTEEQ